MKHNPASHCVAACSDRNRSSFAAIAALFLVGAGGILSLDAKPDTAQSPDKLPGLGLQPVEYFYTGKPYDADTETYTFRYRNYDPELNRWTTADPSGFPDGANNQIYVRNPITNFDAKGLETIDSINQALEYWRRPAGSAQDSVTAGSSVINNIRNSSGFIELIYNIQIERLQPELKNVSNNAGSGSLTDNVGRGPADIGFVDLVIGRSSISYSDMSSWYAASGWQQNQAGEWGRWLIASTTLAASFADYFNFEIHENDSVFMNLLEEILPGWYAGPGTPFHIGGDFTYNFDTYAWQYE